MLFHFKKALQDILQHFRFVNWWFCFFDVTSRLFSLNAKPKIQSLNGIKPWLFQFWGEMPQMLFRCTLPCVHSDLYLDWFKIHNFHSCSCRFLLSSSQLFAPTFVLIFSQCNRPDWNLQQQVEKLFCFKSYFPLFEWIQWSKKYWKFKTFSP